MAKRFTDTGKWDKVWFRKLSPLEKCIWLFLCDRCDHAGVWDIDEDAFEYFIGEDCTIDWVVHVFGDKVQKIGDKLLISDFVEFQYSTLNPENRVHKSVIERIERLKKKGLPRTLQGTKDTDTEKDKDKDKEETIFDEAQKEVSTIQTIPKISSAQKFESRFSPEFKKLQQTLYEAGISSPSLSNHLAQVLNQFGTAEAVFKFLEECQESKVYRGFTRDTEKRKYLRVCLLREVGVIKEASGGV